MLNLASTTDARWTAAALAHLEDVLLDHAHCEKKAAGAAIKLLFAYPHHGFMQRPLAELAREELSHYQQALEVLDGRGIKFRRQPPSL